MNLSEVRITLRHRATSGVIRAKGFWEAWIEGRPSPIRHKGRSKAEALGRCLLTLPDCPHTVYLDAPPATVADGEGGAE